MEQAKVLILNKKITTSEVAASVGFTDQGHLHRHFKRTTGYTPREFLLSR
ncbi:helix-turn-helix domain-containing protein [Paenibacillus alkalitolerans]